MRTLIIVPAYNEAENLPKLIPEIKKYGWDSLVINDGSTDRTEEVLEQYGFEHLNLVNNIGIAGVTQIGFMYARDHGFDCALVVDGDGQHPPFYIQQLIKEVENGYDYVVGSRFVNEKKPFSMRMIGSRLICLAIRIKTGKKVSDPTSGMRALGKKVLADFSENMNFVAEPDALTYIIRRGYKYIETPVKMEERDAGESYFHNPFKTIRYMFNTLMSILLLQW